MVTGAEKTKIGIGTSDGYRYLGIKPPLDATEIEALARVQVLNPSQLEQVTYGPACSLVRYYTEHLGAEGFGNQHILAAVAEFATSLETIRGEVTVIPEIMPMQGVNSSPFNPDTTRNPA